MPIVIHDLDPLRPGARNAIVAAKLGDTLGAIAKGPYGMTIEVLRLLHAIETGLASLVASRRAIIGRLRADRRVGFASAEPSADESRFASLMAAYIGSSEALAACAIEPRLLPPPDKHLPIHEYRSLVTGDEPALLDGIAGDLAQYVGFYRDHDNPALRLDPPRLPGCVASYFSLLAATCARLGSAGDHRAMLDALHDGGLTINGVEYRGFARQTALPMVEEVGLMPVMPEDIVGNRKVLDAGLALARAVAGFDLERGENPRPVRNQVLFVLGAPGCGKTITAHAIGNYFLDLCQRHDIPARFRIIRRTDWASHYQNKSASELLRIFRQEIFDFPGVAGAYWPDIDTAFAAREDPSIRAEEKAVLGTLFGLLDGTIGPKNGKWFLLADANFLTMDEAALSRLTQDPHYAKGPESAGDFVELLRDKKLSAMAGHFSLSDKEWQHLGQRCVEAGLSGRAVDNISGKLLSDIDTVNVPEDYFSMAYEDKVAVLEERRKTLDFDHLQRAVERYIEFEKDAEGRARSERFERRVSEIREQLAARVAAVGGLDE